MLKLDSFEIWLRIWVKRP